MYGRKKRTITRIPTKKIVLFFYRNENIGEKLSGLVRMQTHVKTENPENERLRQLYSAIFGKP